MRSKNLMKVSLEDTGMGTVASQASCASDGRVENECVARKSAVHPRVMGWRVREVDEVGGADDGFDGKATQVRIFLALARRASSLFDFEIIVLVRSENSKKN